MEEQSTTPVLFIIFNRPDTTQRVFEQIRAEKPTRLYIAADGPRKNMDGESERCEVARKIATSVDWDCKVGTLFQEKNAGCKIAEASAMDWFFNHEPEGIILEDDCLPHPTFFRFCTELLAHFRGDERVMMISGTNHLGRWKDDRQSYHFSTGGAWGWAGWRRAWRYYDVDMTQWTDPKAREALRSLPLTPRQIRDDERNYRLVYEGKMDTWDYQWRFARLIRGGLTVTPSRNLVSNIGFRPDGTHTRKPGDILAELPLYQMEFPLKHNPVIELDREFVRRAFELSHPRLLRRGWNFARKIMGLKRNVIP